MKLLALFLVAAMVSTVTAQDAPKAVFEMDSSGNAKMTITEAMSLDVDQASIMASADLSNVMSFSGSITDSGFAIDPDYSMRMSMVGSNIELSFEFSRGNIQALLDQLGDFSLTFAIEDSDGTLSIALDGTVSRAMFEEGLLLDVDLIQADPEGMRADLETLLNDVFSALNVSTAPRAVIDDFRLTGQDTLTLNLGMKLENWGAFMATMMALSGQQTGSLTSCLNVDPNQLIAAMAAGGLTVDFSVSGSGDSISGSLDASSSADSTASQIQSLNLELSKIGSVSNLQGSAGLADAQTFITCLMRGALPGDYITDGVDYTLAKTAESGGVQSLEAQINGMAEKSGSNYVVTFPASTTANMDITVRLPSGMDVLSVSGGTQSEKSATSTSGEEFSVTYGKAGGIDMTWIIAIIVVVVVLILVSKGKLGKKK